MSLPSVPDGNRINGALLGDPTLTRGSGSNAAGRDRIQCISTKQANGNGPLWTRRTAGDASEERASRSNELAAVRRLNLAFGRRLALDALLATVGLGPVH